MFKFKVGDQVIVTAGKDKGIKNKVLKINAAKNQVVVAGANQYTRHIKKMAGQAGQTIRKERPLDAGKVAILNSKGQPDRVGFEVSKTGVKIRVFKKTGQPVPTPKVEK